MENINKAERKFTCRDLLLIPAFADARVLAGESGLDAEISHVNVMEVPDIINWVRPGELLMTTGYPYKDSPEEFLKLIPQLVDKKVAALGIKPKRFIDEIPLNVIKCAQKYNLPLIQLPPSTTFSQIVRDVMEMVISNGYSRILLLQERIKSITDILLNGKGMADSFANIESILNNPVAVINSYNNIIASDDTLRLINNNGFKISWDCISKHLEEGYLMIDGNDDTSVKTHLIVVSGNFEEIFVIILLEINDAFSDLDRSTLERISSLIGIEIRNEKACRKIESKYYDAFIQDLLSGRIRESQDILMRASTFRIDMDFDKKYTTAVLCIRDDDNHVVEQQDILKHINYVIRSTNNGILSTIYKKQCVVIIPKNNEFGSAEKFMNLYNLLKASIADYRLSICLNSQYETVDSIYKTYNEAYEVKCISLRCNIMKKIITMNDVGIYSILYLIPKSSKVNKFKAKFILPLIEHDKFYGGSLINTLKIYYECKSNIRATAKAMYTHYNTIVYRLDKISTVLGMDIGNPDIELQLRIALKLKLME